MSQTKFGMQSRELTRQLVAVQTKIKAAQMHPASMAPRQQRLNRVRQMLTSYQKKLASKILVADAQESTSGFGDISRLTEEALSEEAVCGLTGSRQLLMAPDQTSGSPHSSAQHIVDMQQEEQALTTNLGQSRLREALEQRSEVDLEQSTSETRRWRRRHRRRRRRRWHARRRRWRSRRRFTGTLTQNTYAQVGIDPAVTYYSNNNDVSIRVESRKRWDPEEVYLELRNKRLGQAWKLGMNDDYNLHIGWGTVGTANGSPDAIRLQPNGNIDFYGKVEFRGEVQKSYSESGMQCVAGGTVVGHPQRWSSWSRCPRGYSVTGLQGIYLHNTKNSHRGKYQDIDHYQCYGVGCRAWCRGDKCDVVARCCKTESSPLRCYASHYRHQRRQRWGHPAYCHHRYTATGFSNLDLHNNRYWKHQMINDFYVSNRYARSWCWGSNCGVRARCCRPRNWGHKLQCIAGTKAYGHRDSWGPYSTCPSGYTVMTHQRIDMLDHRHPNRENMHKYECNDSGCRAWCWGSACHTWAKCCRIIPR